MSTKAGYGSNCLPMTETPTPAAAPPSPDAGEEPKAGPKLDPIALLAGVGLALSIWLEAVHVNTFLKPSANNFCTVGKALDCAAVAASPYAVFLGVPWALWGAIGFIAIFVAALHRSKWLLILSGVAALVSLALLGISLFAVGSICLFCEAVHLVAFAIFAFAYKKRGEFTGAFDDWSKVSTILALPAGLAVALMLFLPSYWSALSYKAPPSFTTGVTEDGYHWIGSEKPDLVIHEYVYHRCPHCKAGSTALLQMLGEHPNWRIVRHEQPITSCSARRETTCPAERMTYCAAEQGKFWQADRWLFAYADPRKSHSRAALIEDLNLDRAKFETCYASEAAFEYGAKRYEDSRDKGIINVPAYEFEGEVPEQLKPLAEKTEEMRKTVKE